MVVSFPALSSGRLSTVVIVLLTVLVLSFLLNSSLPDGLPAERPNIPLELTTW